MDKINTLSSGSDGGEEKFCPVLHNPEPDCYCFNLNSQGIAFALQYCQGNYLACDIYQRVKNKENL
jgi:hypothetical protein